MKYPEFDWIPFDRNNPPSNINPDGTYLVIVREDDYNDGKTWHSALTLMTFGIRKTIGVKDKGWK